MYYIHAINYRRRLNDKNLSRRRWGGGGCLAPPPRKQSPPASNLLPQAILLTFAAVFSFALKKKGEPCLIAKSRDRLVASWQNDFGKTTHIGKIVAVHLF
jgi:hypothetical protein